MRKNKLTITLLKKLAPLIIRNQETVVLSTKMLFISFATRSLPTGTAPPLPEANNVKILRL